MTSDRVVPQDYAQAAAWFRRAADQGHANAQYNLGLMYGAGEGVPQDYAQAVTWYRQAAEQGRANAQYNLTISFDQFADLNARIGGHDLDGVIVPGQRARANPDAVRIAYETGRLNAGQGGLRHIPILDVRGYTDGICTVAPCPPRDPTNVDVHDGYHTLVARASLLKANGNADNHVRIVAHEVGHCGPDSILGIVSPRAVAQLDQWLTDIVADTSDMPQAQKVAAHRPADFVDACYTAADAKITSMDRCAELFPIASDARIVAGAPLAKDVLKCTLKPVDPNDLSVSLSAEQLGALRQIFGEGVCDYSRPGIGQVPLAGTWAIYTGNAEVRYLRPADSSR